MKTRLFKSNACLFIGFIAVLSCSSNSNQDKNPEKLTDSVQQLFQTTKNLFEIIPSPVEIAEIIAKADVKFDERILNPVSNVPYYETSQIMALNLGIYVADLSYASLFDQREISLKYLNSVKTLSDGLGLIHLISQDDILKLESNLFNKDSIKIMAGNVFFNSGMFLNDNNRPEIALFVQVGGWIEGMYIAMQTAKQSGHINKELVERMVEQYESLKLIIGSLEAFSSIASVNEVLNDMNSLKQIYDKMLVSKDNSAEQNQVNLAKTAQFAVTPELFLSLYHQIIKIRNSYTQ